MAAGSSFDLATLSKSPIAAEAVRRIDELFEIERTINGKTPAERVAVRQERAKPLINDLEVWMRQQRDRLAPSHDLAKAINYLLSRWVAFTRFLHDGRICLSNNAAERAVRCVAMLESLWIPCSSVCKHWNRVVVSDATRATFSGHRRFDRFRRQVVGANLVWRAGYNLHRGQHAGFDQAAYRVACDA
jgi:transposase